MSQQALVPKKLRSATSPITPIPYHQVPYYQVPYQQATQQQSSVDQLTNQMQIFNPFNPMATTSATMVPSSATTSSATTASTTNQGKMQFKGMFGGSITYSGYPVDQVKSGLQKYIRGNNVEKALICAFELYRFKELNGAILVSNMYNRLAVIAAEDIGPANITLALSVINYVLEENSKEVDVLSTIVKSLCASQKTRVLSHFWRAYVLPPGIKLAEEKGIKVDREFDLDPQYSFEWFQQDPQELIPFGEMFNKRLKQHDANAFAWLGMFMLKAEGKKMAKRKGTRRTKAMEIIWLMLKPHLRLTIIFLKIDLLLC
jgi:hypothetical protein